MGSHLFQLSKLRPQIRKPGGTRLAATKRNFPALQGMSFYKLVLEPFALREPHWHANADELGYCLKGSALVSFYASGNQREVFLVQEGDAFLIPSGSLHSIENVGKMRAELILQFSHEEPEDFNLSTTFPIFSNAVLGNTWHLPLKALQGVHPKESFIAKREESIQIPEEARYPSPYRYSLGRASPLIDFSYGSARVARHNVWPILKRQALYSLEISGKGMREPHWHPETAEMGYVAKGRGRMSIQSPNGKVDTYEMGEGDLYFIPKAYPHHIECLSKNLHIMIFFDRSMPGDVGFTASVKAFPIPSLAACLQTPESFIEKLPKYYEDLFIVEKINPLDLK
ncbi:MAG: cupin domain-containing protein [Verrucomicrobia bacterium]|nr:cupin domain-containing protein [Verrucomicrobiota bacterium]